MNRLEIYQINKAHPPPKGQYAIDFHNSVTLIIVPYQGRRNISTQHTVSEAADIQIPNTPYTEWTDGKAHTDKYILNRWFDWIQAKTDFDQLIMETSNVRDF